MIDAIELRKQVRVILSTRRDEAFSENYILVALGRFFPETVKPSEMMLALWWNEARGYVEKRRNSDEERDEWILTGHGLKKEGF